MEKSQPISLGTDGIIVVLIGNTGMIQEYKNHPQVRFIDCKTADLTIVQSLVPGKTKAVIITEGIPRDIYMWATSLQRSMGIVWLLRKSNQAIYEFLKFHLEKTVVKVTQEEAKQVRGKLQALLPFIKWELSNAENARLLMNKAVEMGIKTTEGSLVQSVSKERRKQGRSDVPKSVRSQLDISVELFDKFIEELGEMRDYIIQLVEENRVLKAKLDKYKKAFEDIND